MKTVLFYSFKGGVGRTQSLLNIAKYLTEEKNKKIAIVDFDIYAPGLSYLSSNQKDIDTEYFLKYLVNLFEENEKKDIFTEQITENLTLIPAYSMQNIMPYHDLLTDLSQFLYSIKQSSNIETDNLSTVADNIFNVIKEDISKTGDYDYIFFDARTGITEVSDILFSKDVDFKIIISSYNNQNIYGTNEILKILPKSDIQKHQILRVLSPKPDVENNKVEAILAKADLVTDDNYIRLRSKFDWLGTMEIPYEQEIVLNDFNSWDKLDENNSYKKSIKDIANTIKDKFNKESILDELQNLT